MSVKWYEVEQFLTNFASIENTFGDDWGMCIEENTIDDLISTLESNGFRPSIIRTVSDLVNELGLSYDYILNEMGIDKIKSADASLRYCHENDLEVIDEHLDWFEGHNWKIPKITEGFDSYIGYQIYKIINEDKRNFIERDELEEVWDTSEAPRRHTSFHESLKRNWRKQIQRTGLNHGFDGIEFLLETCRTTSSRCSLSHFQGY